MTEQEIKAAVKAIAAKCASRGLPICYVNLAINDYMKETVHGTISFLHRKQNVEVRGETFAETLDALDAEIESFIPDEIRLARILGIELPQAAE